MIFRVMLYGFGVAMKTGFGIASLKDSKFKSRIKDKKFIMQVKMRNENKGRFYKLDNGKITSKGKISPEAPGVLIEWRDSKTAMKTLLKKDPRALYQSVTDAVTSGNLAVEIEYPQTYAFFEAVKDMAMVYAGFLPLLRKVPGMKKLIG